MFTDRPRGVILHGTRSGLAQDVHAEFRSTVSYVQNGAAGLGWNATIGDDELCIHFEADRWGWNARAASKNYLAVEFAQARLTDMVTDGQVRAFCYWFQHFALKSWPTLAVNFPTHAEIEARGETGVKDGKSDVFPVGDFRISALRFRIVERLRLVRA